jgi:hypothetical protein
MRGWCFVVWVGVSCAFVAACGSAHEGAGFGGNGSGSSGAGTGGSGTSSGSGGSAGGSGGTLGGGDGGFGTFGGDGAARPPPTNGCSGAATDFVYVLSVENDLYSFAPQKKIFTKIGHFGCQTTLTPNSMAVDRNAVAWVDYFDSTGNTKNGLLYRVSTKDASCEAMPAVTLPTTFFHVGMGFSTNFADPSSETLYLAADDTNGGNNGALGEVDTTTGQVRQIAQFMPTQTYQLLDGELTGTGDGRLFGFFISLLPGILGGPMYPTVGLIDKTSAAVQSPATMTGVQQPTDWAFSFWGGHFYLYTSQGPGNGNGSNVTDYDPVSGAINTTYMTAIGFDIVGAGVSTCAPVTPPPPQ